MVVEIKFIVKFKESKIRGNLKDGLQGTNIQTIKDTRDRHSKNILELICPIDILGGINHNTLNYK